MCVPFLRSFLGMRHINFFRGAKLGHFGWGAQKFYVEKVYVVHAAIAYAFLPAIGAAT